MAADYRSPMRLFPFAIAFALCAPSMVAAQALVQFEQHYEGVLGTTFDIAMFGPDQSAMETAADKALAEIARLDAIFSNYRSDSEVSRLNRERMLTGASEELVDVVELCAQWERQTQQRFSCKLGRIINAWNEAEEAQVLPDRMQMTMLATSISAATPAFFRGTRTINLPEPIELELSGIATGYIVDKVLTLLRRNLPDVTAIKLDIGGDAIYWGQPPLSEGWRVAVANPMSTSDSDLLATLNASGRAITASGHSNRFRTIAGQQFSHIFVPSTGWPIENGIGTVTIASHALLADVAATAMTLQSVEAAAQWASVLPDLDGMGIDAAGNQAFSDQWKNFLAEEEVAETAGVLTLNYTLPPPALRGAYYRPYVAIWVSDARQKLVKNLLLLGKEQRWARENTRWWRSVGRTNPAIVDGTARPTRAPGEYRLTWDGRDEAGKPLPAGEYILHVEAARQDGGHSYQSIDITLGTKQQHELAADGELGTLRLEVLGP